MSHLCPLLLTHPEQEAAGTIYNQRSTTQRDATQQPARTFSWKCMSVICLGRGTLDSVVSV